MTHIAMSRRHVVVVSGGTGAIGRAFLKRLRSESYEEIRLLSRNGDQIVTDCPVNVKVLGYDELDQAMSGATVVVHLATRNNDQAGSSDDFDRDNRLLSLRLAEAAKRHGVGRFVFASSTKALSPTAEDLYGISKAAAERDLSDLRDASFALQILRFAPVYGPGVRGNLRRLQVLPGPLRVLSTQILRSIVPIVALQTAADSIDATIRDDTEVEERCVADRLTRWNPHSLFVTATNLAFVALVPTVLALPYLVTAVAISMTSRGGYKFVQRRVGHEGQAFECHKFRTMRIGTPHRGTHEITQSQVTAVGGLLRRFKLDELPQVRNVLRREMNLVGPRPCLESQDELIEERRRYGVFDVRPGITGFAQVNGVDMSEPRLLAVYDHRYVMFRSIAWDLQIAGRTIRGGGFGDPTGPARKETTGGGDESHEEDYS